MLLCFFLSFPDKLETVFENYYQILGRFILGFAAAEIVHRQFVVSFLPASLIVAESARLVQFQVVGQAFGLVVGSLAELIMAEVEPGRTGPARFVNWFMMCLWTIHFFRMAVSAARQQADPEDAMRDDDGHDASEDDNDENRNRESSDSSDSDRGTGPVSRLYHQRSSQFREGGMMAASGVDVHHAPVSDELRRKPPEITTNNPRRGGLRRLTGFAKRIRRLLAFNISIPVSLALIMYSTFSQETLFSSCALIADQYFQWRGDIAGALLGSLTVTMLPTDFVCEKISRRYEERTTVKVKLHMLAVLSAYDEKCLFALLITTYALLIETHSLLNSSGVSC